MIKISVVNDFKTTELTNRDRFQRDGSFNGEDFRKKYLKDFDSKEAWRNSDPEIEIDFEGVTKLGPSWANEVFAHFTRYASPKNILSKFVLTGLSEVKQSIIDVELKKGRKPQ